MRPRTKRRLIVFCYHASTVTVAGLLALAGGATNNTALATAGGLLFWGNLLTWRIVPIGRYLVERLVSTALCPLCGEGIDLVSFWRCGCGFTSPRPRHVLSLCPECRKGFQYLVCPICQMSNPI